MQLSSVICHEVLEPNSWETDEVLFSRRHEHHDAPEIEELELRENFRLQDDGCWPIRHSEFSFLCELLEYVTFFDEDLGHLRQALDRVYTVVMRSRLSCSEVQQLIIWLSLLGDERELDEQDKICFDMILHRINDKM